MNRGAVTGFLVLAVLVGATAALREEDLTAIGLRLVAIQSAIDAESTYVPLPHLQTANSRLAFLDFWEANTFDAGGGYDYAGMDAQTSGLYDVPVDFSPQQYEPGSSIEPQWTNNYDLPGDYFSTPSNSQPQWSGEYDVPTDFNYYQGSAWDDPYNYDPGPSSMPQEVDVRNFYYDGGYASPLDFTGPSGAVFAPVDLDGYGTVVTPSGSGYPSIDPSGVGGKDPVQQNQIERSVIDHSRKNADGRAYAPAIYELTTYAPSIYEITSYPPNAYSRGGGAGYVYEPTWYERAFPVWGSVAVPLLPSQYRPGYGNDCFYNNHNAGTLSSIIGGLSVSDAGFSASLGLGFGNSGYPCYGNSYLGVAPTYFDAPERGGSSRVRPTCSISLADSSIEYGASAVISWSSDGATTASLNGVGNVPLSGTRTLANQTASRTIGITVTGPGGTGACYAALAVSTNQPPSCQISANPSMINRGETSNLAWVSTNATEAALSGVGTVPVQSGRVVSPSTDTTFTLRVRNAANLTATCSAQIDVR